MKKLIMVMMAGVLSLSLLACGKKDDTAATSAEASTEASVEASAEVSVEASTEASAEVSADAATTADATSAATSGAEVPAEYQEWIIVENDGTYFAEEAGISTLKIASKKTVDETVKWYEDKMKEAGLTVVSSEAEVQGAKAKVLAGTNPDVIGAVYTVTVYEYEGKVNAAVTIVSPESMEAIVASAADAASASAN